MQHHTGNCGMKTLTYNQQQQWQLFDKDYKDHGVFESAACVAWQAWQWLGGPLDCICNLDSSTSITMPITT